MRTVSLVVAAACDVCPASFRTSSATTLNPLPSSPARAASIEALSASMCVCFAMARVCAMNFSISADASASASASAVPRATSSARRASSVLLASRRSRWLRASCASDAFRAAVSTAPAASTLAISRMRAASSAAARTVSACWLARSVRSPVVPATSSVEAFICSVAAAICCAIEAASPAAPWIGAGELAQPRHHLAHRGQQRPALPREQGRRHVGHLEVALRHAARHLLGRAERHHEFALQPRHDRQLAPVQQPAKSSVPTRTRRRWVASPAGTRNHSSTATTTVSATTATMPMACRARVVDWRDALIGRGSGAWGEGRALRAGIPRALR